MSSPQPPALSALPGTATPVANSSVRRSATVPARLSTRLKPVSVTSRDSNDGIETLFTHTFTKIISFTAKPSATAQFTGTRRPAGQAQPDAPGSLSWRSVAERTLAVGPLRVYRVTSSNVSFLNSGNFLHTIFPKSQCWCVDGESIFVLRIRDNSYYRIELPAEDKQKAEEFKSVLGKVLQYERTPCPFARDFEVELPEIVPKTVVRTQSQRAPEKAKKWHFDKTWVLENRGIPSVAGESDSGAASSYEDDDQASVNTVDPIDQVPELPSTVPQQPQQAPSVLDRATKFQSIRSVTMPKETAATLPFSTALDVPKLPEYVSPAIELSERIPSPPTDAVSFMSSADSFYSLADTISRAPSPPYMDAQSVIDENPWDDGQSFQRYQEDQEHNFSRGHSQDASDATVTAHSESNESGPVTPVTEVRLSSAPSTPPLVSDSDDSLDPQFLDVPTPPDTIRLRRLTGATQRRAFSPMPHPQNLIRPPTEGPRKQLTAALVRRTCEIILGPPAHLVTLMLRIAAKVSNGAFAFKTYRVRSEHEKRIPCSWESSGDEWDEDDYGIPLSNLEGLNLKGREA